MRALLDINVLIALLDAGHLMHRPAMKWLERETKSGWASCPITENGVIRIMSQPNYPNTRPAAQIAERLAEACRSPEHAFWADDASLVTDGILDWKRLLGHRRHGCLSVGNGGSSSRAIRDLRSADPPGHRDAGRPETPLRHSLRFLRRSFRP